MVFIREEPVMTGIDIDQEQRRGNARLAWLLGGIALFAFLSSLFWFWPGVVNFIARSVH